MAQIFTDLFSQAWLGNLLAIVSLSAAIYFFIRSKQDVSLSYSYKKVELLGGAGAAFPDEIEIRYAGKAISQVTSVTIAIWNSGDVTVHGAQIVASDPLRVNLKKGEILKTRVVMATRDVNKFQINQSTVDTEFLVFDYLDPKDGAVVEILHSGGYNDLKLYGTLRGIPKGLRNLGPMDLPSLLEKRFGTFPIFKAAGIFGAIALVAGILMPWYQTALSSNTSSQFDDNITRWITIVLGLTYLSIPALAFWMRRRRFPQTLELQSSQKNDVT